MVKRIWKAIRPILVLSIILILTIWLYAYFNGGNWKDKLLSFIKDDGLIWLAGSVFVFIVLMILKRVFKIKF